MLTIFCCPKPFVGETEQNQINALRSWRAISENNEILIFGTCHGAREAAVEVRGIHVPVLRYSPTGAPSFNDMVTYANVHGRFELQLYANADILLDSSIVSAMRKVSDQFENFLLVGERLDLQSGASIRVGEISEPSALLRLAASGNLKAHGPTGADYFGFRRGMWGDLPPVFMGRAMCDQALLHHALLQNIPVVDATLAVVALHQFHDYLHVRGGPREIFDGQDMANMSLAHGLRHSLPTVADANWRLGANAEIQPDRIRRSRLRRLEYTVRYRHGLVRTAMLLRLVQYLGGKRSVHPPKIELDCIVHSWCKPKHT